MAKGQKPVQKHTIHKSLIGSKGRIQRVSQREHYSNRFCLRDMPLQVLRHSPEAPTETLHVSRH